MKSEKSDGSRNPQEKRGGIRHRIPKTVEFYYNGKPYIGTIVNQSQGGLFIQAQGPFKPDRKIIIVDPSVPAVSKKREATIVRVTVEGIGVTFKKVGYF